MRLRYITKIAALAILFAAFLWAFDGVVLTPWILDLGLYDVPTFVFMLHAVAFVFLSYFLITKRQELKELKRNDWIAFGLTGLFGGAIGTMAIIAAISQVYHEGLNISVIFLLQKTQPIFAVLLALAWLKERPKNAFYGWAALALAGSYLVTFGFEKPDFSADGMFVPALLALTAAFSFGASTVFSKRAIQKVSHGMGTALRFGITTVVMLVVITAVSLLNAGGVETDYAGFAGFSSVTWEVLGVFVIIALTTGGTAIFFYYWGLKRVLASRSTIYEIMFPVSGIFLEFVIHDKLLSAGQWAGAVIVLGAITAIVNLKQPKAIEQKHGSG